MESFDWKSYLVLAEKIIEDSEDESNCRVSISRAYYSAFNLCKEKFLELSGEGIPRIDSHKFIIDRFKGEKKVARSIGFKLDSLKSKRVVCDYRSNQTINKTQADDMLKTAKQIVEKDLALIDDSFFQNSDS